MIQAREKSSQSRRIYSGALRDEKLGSPQNLFCGVEYRMVCLIIGGKNNAN